MIRQNEMIKSVTHILQHSTFSTEPEVYIIQWNSVNKSTVNKSSRLLHPICLERNRPNPFPL